MPLIINKNTFSFQADASQQQKQYSNTDAIHVAANTHYAMPALTFAAEDKCHHVLLSLNANLPDTAASNIPVCAAAFTLENGNVQSVGFVTNSADNSLRANSHTAADSPIVSIELRVYGGASGFTIPAGSTWRIGATGNDAPLVVAQITGPSPPVVHSLTLSGNDYRPDGTFTAVSHIYYGGSGWTAGAAGSELLFRRETGGDTHLIGYRQSDDKWQYWSKSGGFAADHDFVSAPTDTGANLGWIARGSESGTYADGHGKAPATWVNNNGTWSHSPALA